MTSLNILKFLRGFVSLVPKHSQGPGHAHQQNSVSLGGEGAAVQEQGQVWSDHHGEALSKVPVPRVCTVKLGHAVQHVKLQEVPLHKGPLREQNKGIPEERLGQDTPTFTKTHHKQRGWILLCSLRKAYSNTQKARSQSDCSLQDLSVSGQQSEKWAEHTEDNIRVRQ